MLENSTIKENNDYFELNEADKIILSLIKKNPYYKISNLCELTNYSESYINKIFKVLKKKEYIERVGSNKIGYWEVLK